MPKRFYLRTGLALVFTPALLLFFWMAGVLSGGGPRVGAVVTTLDVDTTLDSTAPSYRACTAAPDDCTLAGAVARTYGTAGYWTINVPAGTYVLSQTGAMEIMNSGSIIIRGAGRDATILDGYDADRIFYVGVAEDLVLNDLTLAHGHAPDGPLNNSNGGAIRNLAGNLTLNRCTLRDNRAGDDSPSRIGGHGGALMVEANDTVLNECIFRNNRAGDSTEGTRGGDGGAVYIQNGFVTMEGCTFTENQAGDGSEDPEGDGGRGGWGGAVFLYLGTLDISRTTFTANRAGMGAGGSEDGGIGGWGGAILNHKGGLSIERSTFVDNRAGDGGDGSANGGDGGSGGAVVNYQVSTFLKHSTVSGNAAGNGGDGGAGQDGYGGYGGGLENYGGTLGVINSTVSGNATGEAGGGGTGNHSGYGGGLDNYHGTVKLANATVVGNRTGSYRGYGGGINNEGEAILKNTIVAHNTASANGPDCATNTSVHSYGYNLMEDTTFCKIDDDGGAGTVAGNIYGQDPQLAALGAYGGPTRTHEPQPGSPVVDAGNPGGCTDTGGGALTDDQRGFARPVDGGTGQVRCDIGAVELQAKAVLAVGLSGVGRVTDDTGALDCVSDCSVGYPLGANVTLTVATVGGWAFDGWGGACTGAGSCAVTMDEDRTVTARFSADHQVHLPLVLRVDAP